jgi:stringent starvation protein A
LILTGKGLGEIRTFGRADDNPDLKAELEAKAEQQTTAIQAWLEQQLVGPWFNGEHFGWADICAAPMVNRSFTYGFAPKEGSKLRAWHERLSARQSVKSTFDEYENGLKAFRDPRAKEAYLSGMRKREYRDHRLEWMVKSGAASIVEKGIKNDNIRFTWP